MGRRKGGEWCFVDMSVLKESGDVDCCMVSPALLLCTCVQILCASIEDEPRFAESLTTLIEEGALPPFPAFVKEGKQKRRRRRKRYEEEAKEAEEMQKKEGLSGGWCTHLSIVGWALWSAHSWGASE